MIYTNYNTFNILEKVKLIDALEIFRKKQPEKFKDMVSGFSRVNKMINSIEKFNIKKLKRNPKV